MDNFLETYSPPKLNQEETDNVKRPITRSEVESVIKKTSLQTKVQDQMASQVNFTKHIKNLYQSFSHSSKRLKRKEYFQRHSIKPPSSWYQKQAKIPPKKKITGQYFDEYRCKNSQQNISKPNPTTHKKDHTLWSSGIYPRDARILQYTQINQCDTPY